jgi:hypothetical protein
MLFTSRQAKEGADVAFEVIKTVERKPPVRGTNGVSTVMSPPGRKG